MLGGLCEFFKIKCGSHSYALANLICLINCSLPVYKSWSRYLVGNERMDVDGIRKARSARDANWLVRY